MRIGKFGFLNNFLPYFYLEHCVHIGESNVRLVEASPRRMVEMLERGEVDFAPAPSFYYISKKEHLRSYDFCISSRADNRGRIFSVIIVSKKMKVDDGDIAVSSQSITSVNLLRIILRERDMKNKIIHVDSISAHDLLKKCPYALIIGDEALKARRKFNVVMDLGEEWYELTGYPMVFGISLSLSHKNMEEANRKIMESLSFGMQNIDNVVEEAARISGLPGEFLKTYFLAISYKMGTEERKGLEVFEEKCMEHRLV